MIGEVKAEVADLHFNPPDLQPVNLQDLSTTLFYTSCYVRLAAQDAGTNEPALAAQLGSLAQSITDFRKFILGGERDAAG